MKKFWKSKTLWLNVASLGLYAAKTHGFDVPAPDPQLVAIVNLILRVVTTKGITL